MEYNLFPDNNWSPRYHDYHRSSQHYIRYNTNQCIANNHATTSKAPQPDRPIMHQDIEDFIGENQDQFMSGDSWLDEIVDDVIKQYDVVDFRTSPIAAKRYLFISIHLYWFGL